MRRRMLAPLTQSLLIGLFLSTITSAQGSSGDSMKLLTSHVGWASTQNRLFWTVDRGLHWKDITPTTGFAEDLAAAFFLDTSSGWALLSHPDPATDSPQFVLASTTDGGASWSTKNVSVPDLDPESTTLSGEGCIDFIDRLHGWMNLGVVSSSNFRLGALLVTVDGGNSWNRAPEGPAIAGSIRFISPSTGWVAGGPGGQKLFVTRDGANSWQEVSIAAPPDVDPNTPPTYDLPIFQDSKSGLLPVTYSGAAGSGLVLVVFRTEDGGKTWTKNRVLSGLPDVYHGMPFPSEVADSLVITGSISHTGHLSLTSVGSGNAMSTTGANSGIPDSAILELSFIDHNHGWVLTARGLVSTADGGRTWTNIHPLIRSTAPGGSTVDKSFSDQIRSSSPVVPAVAPLVSTAHTSVHTGFHMCQAIPVSDKNKTMQTWWNSSPFFDTGIYIGGASIGCPTNNMIITPTWVSAVTNQGWGLMPLWVGPQAPCACWPKYKTCTPFPNVFSSLPSQAFLDGKTEADLAATHATALGLAGTVIYYDLEQYSSASCGSAAQQFVAGWVSELQIKQFKAGVYGAPADAQTDWSKASTIPDDVWIAKTYTGAPKVTIWGLSPLKDGPPWLSGRRIHQYTGNQKNTWGGIAFKIDNDIEDALVIGGNGSKSYSFTFTEINYPGSALYTTVATGINNINAAGGSLINANGQTGQIVGYYADLSGYRHGFLYNQSTGSFTSFDYPAAANTYAHGINDAGQIVGYYEDVSGYGHGFLYNQSTGSFVSLDYPVAIYTSASGINDAGQIVGEYADSTSSVHGFLYNQSTTPFTTIDYPAAGNTAATGINGDGRIVGWYDGVGGQDYHGFLYNQSTGSFTSLDYPAAAFTFASGVNDAGQVVGRYMDYAVNGNVYGFLYDQNTGRFTLLGYFYDAPYGINDAGQIVGLKGAYPASGFVAVP